MMFDEITLFKDKSEKIPQIVSKLNQWGCCSRCVLRFLGEQQQVLYKNPDSVLQGWIDSCTVENGTDDALITAAEGDDTKQNVPVCVTCLGLLQEHCCNDIFLGKICDSVREEGFQFDNFFCALTLPVPIIVREHSIWTLLRALVPEVYKKHGTDEITPIKDVWKWVNGPLLIARLGVPFAQKSPFEVTLHFDSPHIKNECNFLIDLNRDFRRRKEKAKWELFTRANVAKAIDELTDHTFQKNYQCPPKRIPKACEYTKIGCKHDALFIAGRYNKYSRMLSQTPWLLDGKRKSESSVQELICETLDAVINPDEHRFSSAGREDVDVKMLGSGRPFVVEFINPHINKFTQEDMLRLQKKINESTKDIAVHDLQLVTREETERLKEGEIDKTKSYSALCWSAKSMLPEQLEKLSNIKDMVLQQKTPIRVLHRRPLAVREKVVHWVTAKVVDEHHFKITLSTQAGTYVKEFVHGDFGRTVPNLGEILCTECDILYLDVESIDIDWPPHLSTL